MMFMVTYLKQTEKFSTKGEPNWDLRKYSNQILVGKSKRKKIVTDFLLRYI